MSEADAIRQILTHARTIAVVGLSPDPMRPSHDVARTLQARGYRIIPINPNATVILGETAYPSLTAAAQHHRIEVVNCFRKSRDIPPLVEEAIAIGAKAVWMQLGIAHAGAAQRAQAAGLRVVQNKCIRTEHAVLSARGVI
ncbi:putative CoA-binding protein [Rhodoferax ferrireducens]|uniref:CoA-binding protein n=1 Tax=Rhodoferax ferrireducens TaxID=192843 RepID=A0ABU2CG89_9BURK|nr:CoA-binding protein [Rhodoferax ferrireducens]MDR7380358.1 putative CoA-binding protein [Rhodoferax ferrireducens]